ncbi:MAG: AsmA family protein [Candidatus Brocadia sp.]|nr:MAG: AsmA family protein [Candidatus Brocadia sp.]
MRNRVKIPLIAIPSIILIVFIFFSLFINTIIKKRVESFGPKITQTPVNLQKVKMSLFSGHGEIHGLIIGNPEGFHADSALKFDTVTIDIEPLSIFSDTVIIRDILIDGPEITYETSVEGSNIGKIKKNIESYSSSSRSQTKEPGESSSGQKEKKHVQIHTFLLQNGKIRLSATLLQGKTLDIPLMKVQLNDIGKESGSASFPAVIEKLADAIYKAILEAVKGSGKTIEKGIGTVTESVKGIDETAKEGVSKTFEGMKKLFEKK